MPEEKQIRISSNFFLPCKQETKYDISDVTLWKNIKCVMLILFADFHQMATFILWLAVYSRHTVSFLDLTYSCRTLFYDTFDMTLLHLILVTAPNCGYSSSVGMYRNIWSSCFHTFIDRILCFLNNIMQDLRK